ncbi:MAG TPA: ABC transporter substrate-binding protein [Chloroflexota bacterium]|nr:ABC transporter substrate-binding protein [Chloroflexota bacterium]
MRLGVGARMLLPLAAMLLAGCGGGAASSAPPASAAAPVAPASSPAASSSGAAAAKPSAAAGSAAAKPSGAGASAGAASGQTIAIKSGYTTTSATEVPFWVAQEGGYFVQNGLDVTISFVASGAPILAAIESGDLPVSQAGGQEIVNAEVNGSSAVLVGGFGHKPTNSIICSPSITKPEDLKGKTIGVSGIGAISHVAGQLAVQKLGLQGQVNFLATGGLPETLASIKTGKVDCGMLSPPQTFQAVQEQGLREVVDVSKLDVSTPNAMVATTRAYAKDHGDIVDKYLRAMIQGVHRAYTDKPFTVQTIVKYAKITDPNLASKTYDYFHDGQIWDKDGAMPTAAIQTSLDVAAQTSPKAKDFKPDQMVDSTFVQKIDSSGFVDQVWGAKPS